MARNRKISIADDQLPADPIDGLIAGELRSLETGRPIACPIRSVVIQPSLEGGELDLLKGIDFPESAAVICDENTHDALGKRVAAALPNVTLVVIESPKADETAVEALLDRTRHVEALVAVGAGTLNDLAKCASHRRGQPYAVFATAPSMNGYVTATASISRDDEKLSLPATPPKGAFFDLAVLAEAPHRLIRAGVGDSLCRSTAEIDWSISHHLFDTAYMQTPFAIQQREEARLLDRLDDLLSGDIEAAEALVRLLVLGGLGMLIAGSSQPGSQSEHLISHYIDMLQRPHAGSLHGEQVGLATRTAARLQSEILCRSDPPRLEGTVVDAAGMRARFGSLSPSCRAAMARKALDGASLDAANQRLTERWPMLRRIFELRALAPERLFAAFDTIGIAAEPRELGVPENFYRQAVLHARELRDRFTVLDLAADSGLLARFVDEHWPKP